MLARLALFALIEVVYCESYEDEYSEGYDDYAYSDYYQETVHPRSDSGRFLRFRNHSLRTERASPTYDIRGALKQIFAGRDIDLFTDQITPYEPTFQSTLTDYEIGSYFDAEITRHMKKRNDELANMNRSTSTEMSYFFTLNPTLTEAFNMQELLDSVRSTIPTMKLLEPLSVTRTGPADYLLINTQEITEKTPTLTPIRGKVKFKYMPIMRKAHKATRTSAVYITDTTSKGRSMKTSKQDAKVKGFITYKYSPIPRKSQKATRTKKKHPKIRYMTLSSRTMSNEIQTLEEDLQTTTEIDETDQIWMIRETTLSAKKHRGKYKENNRFDMIDRDGGWKDLMSWNILRKPGRNDTNTTNTTTTTITTTPTIPTCRMPPTTTPEPTTTTTTTTTTQRPFDIEYFLAIVANLTADYETNLTRDVNETIQRLPFWTATESTEATTKMVTDYVELKKQIGSKCFVCGLETPGVPQNADCADAFAGDFLPLVPQDPSAKGKIARYRKYCRYGDVYNYFFNASTPRTLYGRWTGGCSVRWTDLSGIYTQRTCRNDKRPVTGLHYGSKRMAKLEMALAKVKNGCIVSPVATLLPLSRGISLYARFHACVCTGNWCNHACSCQIVATTSLATVVLWNVCTHLWGLGLLSFYD